GESEFLDSYRRREFLWILFFADKEKYGERYERKIKTVI
ncbi:MAG: hypothetical protein QG581_307, partial [Patescibacteria group bacterium]|nr:hypothetical protein [Patescibacteria group bacterium]